MSRYNKPFLSKIHLLGIVLAQVILITTWSGVALAASKSHSNPFGHESAFAPSIQALATTNEGTVYAGSFGVGVFVSHDHGDTWKTINSGLGDRFILSLAVDQKGIVYAGTVRGGIFRTKEDGMSWEPISQGLKRVEVKSLLAHSRGIYAGTGRGVFHVLP